MARHRRGRSPAGLRFFGEIALNEPWWENSVRGELSQGDIITGIPFVIAPLPIRYATKRTAKQWGEGWFESTTPFKDAGGRVVLHAAGEISSGIILSHDCELDDQGGSKTVIFARVDSMERVPPEHRAMITDQLSKPQMYLPDVPDLGDCYVNFRTVATVDRNLMKEVKRLASMSCAARKLLHVKLIDFYLHKAPA